MNMKKLVIVSLFLASISLIYAENENNSVSTNAPVPTKTENVSKLGNTKTTGQSTSVTNTVKKKSKSI